MTDLQMLIARTIGALLLTNVFLVPTFDLSLFQACTTNMAIFLLTFTPNRG